MTIMQQAQSSRTITAFFDEREAASDAVEELVKAGFPRTGVRLVENTSQTHPGRSSEQGGFWEDLKGFFLPEEDRHGYAEGLRRGGYLVMVSTDGANYKRAMDILDREGAVDMDQRAESWRKEGWTGYSATAGAVGHTAVENRTPAAASPATRPASGEQTIPVVEEQLQLGKRETGHGRVRIRSYVIEKPVSAQVTLKDEHVSVQRKPVDRPVAPGESGFQERAVELVETREEPVVNKQARVKEEVTLRKEAGQRTETVSDKVKRTEVKVEDERGRGAAQPTRKAG